MFKLLLEAIIVGISIVIFGYIGSFLAINLFPKPLANEHFNKYHVMEFSLFLCGFLAHLVFQLVGLNKWYCKNGVACSK